MYKYKCKRCNKEIIVNHIWKNNKLKDLCYNCRTYFKENYNTYERKCPLCNNIIKYKRKGDYNYAVKENTYCKKCVISSGRYKRVHNNSNTLSVYDCWVKRYGKEIADIKMNSLRLKQSINQKGKNNNMYGKPSPTGSGNGWSGWYKGWYFRSLLELSFMINYIERFKLDWESGEIKELVIPYINKNKINRTYRPDFLINNKYIIECKPKKLFKSNDTLSKKEWALKFCKKNNYIYKIIDPFRLTNKEIFELHDKKLIVFLDRYEKKFKQKFSTPEE